MLPQIEEDRRRFQEKLDAWERRKRVLMNRVIVRKASLKGPRWRNGTMTRPRWHR